jgi:pimeloyl-ACP methyl ester carboxylesterase
MLLPMYHRPEVEEDQPLDPPAVGRLGEITAPTLIIVGEHDRPDTHKIAELLAAGIRRARLAVLPGCAHMPGMERPGLFNELVMDFLASVTTRQARVMGKGKG